MSESNLDHNEWDLLQEYFPQYAEIVFYDIGDELLND